MILPDSYTIRKVDMPDGSEGAISESPDGHINIYINARLSYDGQLKALEHELDHYENDDLHNDDDIQAVECRADTHRLPETPLKGLARASDLPPAKHTKKPLPAPPRPLDNYFDWKDDVFLRLPLWD